MEESNGLTGTGLNSVTRSDSSESSVLLDINVKLQLKVHNLETQVLNLQNEIHNYRGKNMIYESLSSDLACLRHEFNKTAAALLRKCKAYEALKMEVAQLKSQVNGSKSSLKCSPSPPPTRVKLTFSDTDGLLSRKSNRLSVGSCGNLCKDTSIDEGIHPRMNPFGAPTQPLRNKLLTKLHTLRAASTESLESVGRKSLRSEGKEKAKISQKSVLSATKIRIHKVDTGIVKTQSQSSKTVIKAPPSIRPALAQTNNQRLVKMNLALVKRPTSVITKPGTVSKPAFKF